MRVMNWWRKGKFILICFPVILVFFGCATFDVKAPKGMYLSTGDYVPEVETMGILQVKKTVFAFFFMFDINEVRQDLYEKLIDKAQKVNADGLTNVVFFWKLSPLTYPTLLVVSGVFDFYMEGVAIKVK